MAGTQRSTNQGPGTILSAQIWLCSGARSGVAETFSHTPVPTSCHNFVGAAPAIAWLLRAGGYLVQHAAGRIDIWRPRSSCRSARACRRPDWMSSRRCSCRPCADSLPLLQPWHKKHLRLGFFGAVLFAGICLSVQHERFSSQPQ